MAVANLPPRITDPTATARPRPNPPARPRPPHPFDPPGPSGCFGPPGHPNFQGPPGSPGPATRPSVLSAPGLPCSTGPSVPLGLLPPPAPARQQTSLSSLFTVGNAVETRLPSAPAPLGGGSPGRGAGHEAGQTARVSRGGGEGTGRSGVQAGMGRRQEQGEAAAPKNSGAETPGRHSGSVFPWGRRQAALPRQTHRHCVPPRRWPCPHCHGQGTVAPCCWTSGRRKGQPRMSSPVVSLPEVGLSSVLTNHTS